MCDFVSTRRLASRQLLFVGCLTSQQQASVSQGRICSDNFTCCHTETEVADPTLHLTQSQYTDTGPTSPSADPITPGAWQGSHWSANFLSHWYDSTPEKSRRKRDSNPGSSALVADALTTRPTRRSYRQTEQCPILFLGCLTSQQNAKCTYFDKLTCRHTEEDTADKTCYLTQSHFKDTGPTSPNQTPMTPDAWQDSHKCFVFFSFSFLGCCSGAGGGGGSFVVGIFFTVSLLFF